MTDTPPALAPFASICAPHVIQTPLRHQIKRLHCCPRPRQVVRHQRAPDAFTTHFNHARIRSASHLFLRPITPSLWFPISTETTTPRFPPRYGINVPSMLTTRTVMHTARQRIRSDRHHTDRYRHTERHYPTASLLRTPTNRMLQTNAWG